MQIFHPMQIAFFSFYVYKHACFCADLRNCHLELEKMNRMKDHLTLLSYKC